MKYFSDCIQFKGDLPCKPNKEFGIECADCKYYTPVSKRILIIKLGAMGDVIRTTPLVSRYKELYPNCKITWLTLYPDILPAEHIHEILPFNVNTITYLNEAEFDILINLDKEKEACALAKKIVAPEKYGYTLEKNQATPFNQLANHKYLTGIFDDFSKSNTLSYCEEIFAICGLEYKGEEYLLDNQSSANYDWSNIDKNKKVIGLNTGCGGRWTTRLWPEEYFSELAVMLLDEGYEVVLLGGEQEHERNSEISFKSGAKYLGYFPLKQFISQIDQCDLIVTQVTMGMHLTLGLKKKIVLMNNIFNPHEFDVFGRGEIVMPDKECACFYAGKCKLGQTCMYDLPVSKVFSSIKKVLGI